MNPLHPAPATPRDAPYRRTHATALLQFGSLQPAAPLDPTDTAAADDEDGHPPGPRPALTADTRSARRAPSPPLDDDELCALLARIALHDERALEALYDATSARVLAQVRRIASNRALAEEVVEEIYWQVWREAARFDALRGRPLSWLLLLARSRAVDALRRNERFQHDELLDEHGAVAADAGGTLAHDLLGAVRHSRALHAALAQLDARARQLVTLAFFRGMTHEEIGAQEGMPLGSVKSLIRRTLQQLRGQLQAEHG